VGEGAHRGGMTTGRSAATVVAARTSLTGNLSERGRQALCLPSAWHLWV